jgi:biopolymer transport protein ExbB
VEKPQRGDEGDEGHLSPALARNIPTARLLTTPEEIASVVQLALTGNSGPEIILPLDPTLGKALVMEMGEPTLLEELGKGGIWIYPILVFAGVSVIIAFFKAIQILRVRAPVRAASLEGSFTGPFEQLRIAAKENMGRKAEILEEILYERIIDAQVRLEKALPLIAVTAATAPLLGLLGTVTGMIDVFRQITNFANPESSELARGISEALVTTKFGLITAIPSLIVHALLSRRLQGLVAKMETFASRLVNLAANGNGDQPSVEKIEEETEST